MTAKNQDPSLPVDLASNEEAVANWMQSMPRAQAPALMRARVLESVGNTRIGDTRVGNTTAWDKKVGRFGARRLGLAAAALLAVALGTGWVMTGTGTQVGDRLPTESLTISDAAIGSDVVIDEELGLMHGLETFDLVGMDRSELIADW